MRSLPSELRRAIRDLRQSPSFVLPALFTLALGTGATVALLTLLYSLLLRPLPVDSPHELVSLAAHNQQGQQMGLPLPFVPAFAAERDLFESVSASLGSGLISTDIAGALTLAVADLVSGE